MSCHTIIFQKIASQIQICKLFSKIFKLRRTTLQKAAFFLPAQTILIFKNEKSLGKNHYHCSTNFRWRPQLFLVVEPQIFFGDPNSLIGDHLIFVGNPIFSLETQYFHCRPTYLHWRPHFFVKDPQMFMGDPQFFIAYPIFLLENPGYALEAPRPLFLFNTPI